MDLIRTKHRYYNRFIIILIITKIYIMISINLLMLPISTVTFRNSLINVAILHVCNIIKTYLMNKIIY